MSTQDHISMAISVDEYVSICFGQMVDGKPAYSTIESEIFDETNAIASIIEAIQRLIENKFPKFKPEHVSQLSMSFIGLVDSEKKEVYDVARPNWKFGKMKVELIKLVRKAINDLPPTIFNPNSFHVYNDATACALGERAFGAGKSLNSTNENDAFCFIRVGDGVNAGILINGQPWRGGLHPEVGHIKAPLYVPSGFEENDMEILVTGICPKHIDCLEGKISKQALLERWNCETLDKVWKANPFAEELTAHDIAFLCSVLTMLIAPKQIVLGGSVITDELCKKTRDAYLKLVRNYPNYHESNAVEKFIVKSELSGDANILGLIDAATRRLNSGAEN